MASVDLGRGQTAQGSGASHATALEDFNMRQKRKDSLEYNVGKRRESSFQKISGYVDRG
jgi:hypothetical protein